MLQWNLGYRPLFWITGALAFLLSPLDLPPFLGFVGVYPVTRAFRQPKQEAMYTTLLMSTGLTFGSISALYGLTHGIVTQAQYSYLVATVVGSAVVPTLIANAFFLPRHLIPRQTSTQTAADVSQET